MAQTLQYLDELTGVTLKDLSNKDNWIDYLKTASHMYKYPFFDSMLIYAQRPDATAVASYALWNKKLSRYVNRGVEGIALIQTNSRKAMLKYVFDVSDTNGRKLPYVWLYKDEFDDIITDDIAKAFDISINSDLENTISNIADSIIEDNMPEYLKELSYVTENSFLEELDELNLKIWYRNLLKQSVEYTVLLRCGYNIDEISNENEFSNLYNFNTPQTMIQLGEATSDFSEMILREIEKSVKRIEKEQRIERRGFHSVQEKSDISSQNNLGITESIQNNNDRSSSNDSIQTGRQPQNPDLADERTGRAGSVQTGHDEERIPAQELQSDILDNDANKQTVQPLPRDGATGTNADRHEDSSDEENDIARTVDDTLDRDRTASDTGNDLSLIDEQADIDHVLLSGSGFEGGKQRIIDFYAGEHTPKEKAVFLKDEYGIGGGTVVYDNDRRGYQDHNAKGIDIHNNGFGTPSIHLTWSKAAKQIGALIDDRRYYKQRYLLEKPLIKPIISNDIETLGADEAPFSLEENNIPDTLNIKKRKTQPEMNFSRLKKLVPHIIDKRYSYAKLQSDGFMDLSIEWIDDKTIAIAHYGEQNGDLMADPDMTLIVDTEKKTIMPATFQNDYAGLYQEVYSEDNKWKPKLSKELTSFLSTWLKNIENQGHVLRLAIYYQDELQSNPIALNEEGQEYGFDVPHDIISMTQLEPYKIEQAEKEDIAESEQTTSKHIEPELQQYELGFGELGNGITVWNTLKEVDNDYQTIAHIGEDGAITYYVDDLPSEVIEQIEIMAALTRSDNLLKMREDGYKWDGMIQVDDEEALRLFDAGYDIYLLHDDNTESLAESEKRLIQHINDGGFIGIEKESEYLLEEVLPEIDEPQKQEIEYPIIENAEEYKPFFEAIVKQGNMTKNGKTRIVELVNESSDMTTFISELKNMYGDFWSEVKFNDETIRWHITPNGFDVFVNGFDKSRLHYSWEEISSTIIDLVNSNTYLEQTELPTSRLHEGMIVTLDDRTYKVESLDILNDKIELADLTFAQGTGFPIFRKENLTHFENELEKDDFFDRDEQSSEAILQAEKKNYHITDDNLGTGGAKEKYKRNIEAIRLLKTLESENKFATVDEQEILSKYVGWGGLAKVFDDTDNSWNNEYAELAGLLDNDEYKTARSSVLNAFYTSPVVIKAMYQALENMGFRNGNVLEPAMGIGNFLGLIPDSMNGSKLYGVELDSITGRIAKQLYQNADVRIQGFETTEFPDNFFDVAIGNVPFGSFGVSDKKYDKYKFMIHDYFFAKTLDKVRAGGVVAFITSKGTLDKANSSVRKYIAQRAELIGAIRLPNNAFKANAGTSVTSDIIFLKKRDSIIDIEPEWVNLGQTWDNVSVNQYYADNPHMLLGTMVKGISMYGNEDETTCEPFDDRNLDEQLADAIKYINADIEFDMVSMDESEQEDTSIPANPDVKNFSFCIVDDKVYYRENSRMNLINVNITADKRIRGMIGLGDAVHKVINYQLDGNTLDAIKLAQSKLNFLYDNYTKTYGIINSRANNLAFRDDNSYYLLCSLEILDEKQQFDRKADLFSKLTIRPNREISHVDTVSEALAVSLARKGKVDLGYMSSLTNKETEDVIQNLEGIIFKNALSNPDNVYDGWETADEYLSGNVRNKLEVAKNRIDENSIYEININALEQVQPKDLEASDIDVRLGTIWIPPTDIKDFIFDILETPPYLKWDIEVLFSNHSASWNVSGKRMDRDNINAYETYGTSRMNGYKIIEDSLNQKSVKVYDRITDADDKTRSVLNKNETLLATQRQTLLQEAFKDWIFKDENRRNRLVSYYNEHFNNLRPREYDGSHIEFIGMTPEIKLREHQVNSVAGQLYGNNTLLAHVVGAGKSFAMIAAGMESKRLGLSNKNLYVVPNHLTGQLAAEALRLYPAANVLVATKKDFQTNNRKKFCSKIATGDYDIVIIGHSQFERIPLSDERQINTLQRELDTIIDGIAELKADQGQRFNVKQMEASKKRIEVKLKNLNNYDKRDNVVTFEELGVDRLFVDESHMYKNLYLFTKMNNVAGISKTEAQKSTDMYMKCQYIDEITDGKGITFATGTPISNSMTEMYTVQRYLQMQELRERGLHHFDSWASVFGETQTAYELAPEGTRFRSKTRFSKFYNLPELMAMFKNIADIQTSDMLKLPVPELKTGQVQNITIQPTEIQKQLYEGLGGRADQVHTGMVDATIDNMLKITNDGRMIALDQRHENPLLPDDPNSKVNVLMRNVYDIWDRTKDNKSTQLVFSDISTPKHNGQFNIYEDLKRKWIEKGIPESEIAFIQDTNNEKQKEALFDKVRSGEVRILLGSTFMMGSGMNVQNKLIAVHHADVPWRPSDLEQRNGRILRQGNENPEIEIFRYITEGTFDSYSYQLIEQKQRYISQIMTSKSAARSADDIDEATLTYAEVKALATGNPHIKEKMELDVEVSKIKVFKTQFRNQQYRLETKISSTFPRQIKASQEFITGLEKDITSIGKHDGNKFIITLKEQVYNDKTKAGKYILELCTSITTADTRMSIGNYKGMAILISFDKFDRKYHLHVIGSLTHTIELGNDSLGNIQRLDNRLKSLPEKLSFNREKLANTITQLDNAKIQIQKPFEQEDELKEKLVRLDVLNHELSMDERDDNPDIGDEGNKRNEETNEKIAVAR